MRRRSSAFVLTLAMAALLAGPQPGRAEPYHDPILHFSVEPPRGWKRFTKTELQEADLQLRARRSRANVEYLTGYRRFGVALPSAVVAYQPGSANGAVPDDWERAASEHLGLPLKDVDGSFSNVAANIAVDEAGCDRAKRQFFFRSQIKDATGPVLELIGVGHVGAKGTVLLYFLSEGPPTPRDWAAFERMNDSLQFDPGSEFVPVDQRPGIWEKLAVPPEGRTVSPLKIGGGVAVAVLAVGGLCLALIRRRSAVPRTPW